MPGRKKTKQFAVIGLGRFGSSVARTLCAMGYDVLAVDREMELVQDIADQVTHAVRVDVTDEAALLSLGLRDFDVAVVAIGADIQASILVTMLLKEQGVPQVLAKAGSELHAKVLAKVGADRVVFPERDMGVRTAHSLGTNSVLDYIELSADHSMVELEIPAVWEGKSMMELKLRQSYGLNVVAVRRQGGGIDVSPSAQEKLHSSDVLIAVAKRDDLRRLDDLTKGK